MSRILVVDDDAHIRSLLRRALEIPGHEVLEAADGQEALRICRTTRPDLVITDIRMPGKDGLDVIMTLGRESPGLRVIAMSGADRFARAEALQMAAPLGAFATLRKPFGVDVVLDLVDRALAA